MSRPKRRVCAGIMNAVCCVWNFRKKEQQTRNLDKFLCGPHNSLEMQATNCTISIRKIEKRCNLRVCVVWRQTKNVFSLSVSLTLLICLKFALLFVVVKFNCGCIFDLLSLRSTTVCWMHHRRLRPVLQLAVVVVCWRSSRGFNALSIRRRRHQHHVENQHHIHERQKENI